MKVWLHSSFIIHNCFSLFNIQAVYWDYPQMFMLPKEMSHSVAILLETSVDGFDEFVEVHQHQRIIPSSQIQYL